MKRHSAFNEQTVDFPTETLLPQSNGLERLKLQKRMTAKLEVQIPMTTLSKTKAKAS